MLFFVLINRVLVSIPFGGFLWPPGICHSWFCSSDDLLTRMTHVQTFILCKFIRWRSVQLLYIFIYIFSENTIILNVVVFTILWCQVPDQNNILAPNCWLSEKLFIMCHDNGVEVSQEWFSCTREEKNFTYHGLWLDSLICTLKLCI